MSRPSRLLYLPRTGADESTPGVRVLAECPDGIPVGWIFCFGGRNYWNVDEAIADRGGDAASRSPFETPIEVAEARLLNATEGFEAQPHLYVWFASFEVLRRRLQSHGRTGFLRVDAPFLGSGQQAMETFRKLTAYAENLVNMVNADRLEVVPPMAALLAETCPFVPRLDKSDDAQFRRAPVFANLAEVDKAARLIIGAPTETTAVFNNLVQTHYAPVFDARGALPPYPALQTVGAGLSGSSTTVPRPDVKAPAPVGKGKPAKSGGLLSRLFGRFRRR